MSQPTDLSLVPPGAKRARLDGMTPTEFATIIKGLGLTPAEASRVLDISRRHVDRMIRGHTVPPDVRKLLRLALAGKITVEDIRGV